MKLLLFLLLSLIYSNPQQLNGNQSVKTLRVISLLPSYTEIIFELGSGNSLVGVTNFCNWPTQAKEIAKVGDYINPDREMIYKLKPDIIFMGEWKNDVVKSFAKKRGIKIVVIPQEKRVDDIYTTIKTIAKYLKKEDKALELIKQMKARINLKEARIKTLKKVYIDLDFDFWTCGSESFISDVISKAGGVNIFNDVKQGYFKTSWEEIVRRNPDVILIISSRKPDEFISFTSSQKVSAIKNLKVYKFSDSERDIISRPAPRIVEIIDKLREILQ